MITLMRKVWVSGIQEVSHIGKQLGNIEKWLANNVDDGLVF